jgi:hypothetical protein
MKRLVASSKRRMESLKKQSVEEIILVQVAVSNCMQPHAKYEEQTL